MSNKTQLQTNNDKLTSLIEELANKATGSDSNGGTVNTCTVVIYQRCALYDVAYTTYINGTINAIYESPNTSEQYMLNNVVCNSIIYTNTGSDSSNPIPVTENGVEILGDVYNGGFQVLKAPSIAGVIGYVTVEPDDPDAEDPF